MQIDDIPEAAPVGAEAEPKAVIPAKAKRARSAAAKKVSKSKKAATKKTATKAVKSKAEVKLRPDGLREGSAGGKLVDAVCSKKGVTHAEACEIVGWKQCLPFLVKSCQQAGVKIRKELKPGEAMRYYGIRKSR